MRRGVGILCSIKIQMQSCPAPKVSHLERNSTACQSSWRTTGRWRPHWLQRRPDAGGRPPSPQRPSGCSGLSGNRRPCSIASPRSSRGGGGAQSRAPHIPWGRLGPVMIGPNGAACSGARARRPAGSAHRRAGGHATAVAGWSWTPTWRGLLPLLLLPWLLLAYSSRRGAWAQEHCQCNLAVAAECSAGPQGHHGTMARCSRPCAREPA